ncbi:MAG: CsiV family protein [Pseudomonadales bacterium]
MRATAIWFAALLLTAGPPAHSTSLNDYLSERWFVTEVVVFVRPDVKDFATEENLVRHRGASFPRSVASFRAEEFGSGYRLDPVTRLMSTVPLLELLDPPAGDQDQDQDQDQTAFGDEQLGDGRPAPEISPILESDPLLDFLQAVADYEADLEAQSYRWLDQSTATLTAEVNRLNRTPGYQVLLHGHWLQPVPERQSPQPLLVQAGPRYGGVYGLEGSFDVTVGRFLHFRADLFYREPLLGGAPIDRALPPQNGVSAIAPQPRPQPTLQDLSTEGFMHLQESRRMRSGELHYLDHPKFGVLVRIEPAPPPESLSARHAALKESAQ